MGLFCILIIFKVCIWILLPQEKPKIFSIEGKLAPRPFLNLLHPINSLMENQCQATVLIRVAHLSSVHWPQRRLKKSRPSTSELWRAPRKCLHGVSWVAQTFICKGPVSGFHLCEAQKLSKRTHLHRGQVKTETGSVGGGRGVEGTGFRRLWPFSDDL